MATCLRRATGEALGCGSTKAAIQAVKATPMKAMKAMRRVNLSTCISPPGEARSCGSRSAMKATPMKAMKTMRAAKSAQKATLPMKKVRQVEKATGKAMHAMKAEKALRLTKKEANLMDDLTPKVKEE